MCRFFLIMMLPYKILSNRFQGRYQFTGAYLFMFIFSVIEMDKLDKPHNFEPQIYNTERGARDRLIYDYNTMSIRDFNEKYGGLWDFTMKREDMISPWQVSDIVERYIPYSIFSLLCSLSFVCPCFFFVGFDSLFYCCCSSRCFCMEEIPC